MSETFSLRELQLAAGAVFAGEHGGGGPVLYFSNPHGEYAVAQTEAGLLDFDGRAHVRLTGSDRAKFLHNFCTNDILVLHSGQGCEAFITNVSGMVLAHIFVFVGEEAIWLDAVKESEAEILAHLDKYVISEDVQIHSQTAGWGELFLTGPDTVDRLTQLGLDVETLQPFEHLTVQTLGFETMVRRCDLIGGLGFLLLSPREKLADLWSQLTDAGFRPVGTAAFEALRIEAGFPMDGQDITSKNLAQEVARTDSAICFTKGCYLGQEPIARIDALGHVNRELRGIELSTSPVPQPGDAVLAGKQETQIGTITSAALSYRNDLPVALAYVHRNHLAPGTAVRVRCGEHEIPGVIFTARQ